MYLYQTAQQKLTKPHTLYPIGPTVIFLLTGSQSVTDNGAYQFNKKR